jgi:hypothetical protein
MWGGLAAKKPGACHFVIAALQGQHPKIASFRWHVSNEVFQPTSQLRTEVLK